MGPLKKNEYDISLCFLLTYNLLSDVGRNTKTGIVSESGNIRGCYDEVFDGVTVSDKLRELLANPASANADAVFSKDRKGELLLHVFKALCIGGALCQPNDKLEAYTNATKTLYKVGR